MFGFGKRKTPVEDDSTTEIATDSTDDSLTSRLAKTRRGLGDSMADFFLGKKSIDRDTLDELDHTEQPSVRLTSSTQIDCSRKAARDNR